MIVRKLEQGQILSRQGLCQLNSIDRRKKADKLLLRPLLLQLHMALERMK